MTVIRSVTWHKAKLIYARRKDFAIHEYVNEVIVYLELSNGITRICTNECIVVDMKISKIYT